MEMGMSDFNWGAYERWCNRMEWDNEPHDLESCECEGCEEVRGERDAEERTRLAESQEKQLLFAGMAFNGPTMASGARK